MVTPASTIDVSGPAQAGTVGLLRAVAASLAARLGMDVEAIEELRMAVDEASSRARTRRSRSWSIGCSDMVLPFRLQRF